MKRKFFKASFLIFLNVFFLLRAQDGQALPAGYTVEAGDASFDTSDPLALQITASDNAILNFQDFSIAQNESVRFIQSSVNSNVLTRVTGQEVSNIFGSLFSNGNLAFVNPNGIVFHESANVQTGSLIASTLDIQNANFVAGQMMFEKGNGNPALILNQGNIFARDGGYVALVSDEVVNRGTITARLGSVVLASGQKATVNFDGQGLINLVVNEGLSTSIQNAVSNQGTIHAPGGKVIMNAKTARDTWDTLVNNTGVVQAGGVIEKDGEIEIVASGSIEVSGELKAKDGNVTVDARGGNLTIGNTNTEGETILKAKGDIIVRGDVATDSGNLSFVADSDLDGQGAFLQTAGTTVKTTTFGDINIQSSGESTLANIESAGDVHLDRAGADVTYTQVAGSTMKVAGSVYIKEGVTLREPSVSAISPSSFSGGESVILQLGANWVNQGVFIAGDSLVQLVSTLDAEVSGNNTFHDFTVVEPLKKVTFESGKLQEFTGTLTLKGEYGKLLTVKSSDTLVQANFSILGPYAIEHINLQGMNNILNHGPPAAAGYSLDSLNNSGFSFNHLILTPTGYRNISEINIGDQVIAYDSQGAPVLNVVEGKQVFSPSDDGSPQPFYLINGQYLLYKNQSVWANGRVIHAFEIKAGDNLQSETGQGILVRSIETPHQASEWTTFNISGNHSYVMDGLLLHNASRYWVGGGASANWDATGNTNWGSASNTQDNASVPTSSDDVFFDGVGTGASNSTLSANITVRSADFTGYVNTLTHNSSVTLSIGDATAGAGNVALKLVAGMTYTISNASSAISFVSTSATQQTVTSGGKTLGSLTFNATSNGSWIFTSAITLTTSGTGQLVLTKGSLDTGNQTISAPIFSTNTTNVRTLSFGSSSITISGTNGGVWNFTATNLTFDAGTSTITFAAPYLSNFAGGGLTYNNVVFSGVLSTQISGANTFANLTRTGTASKTDGLTLTANQTVTGTLTLAGNSATNRILVTSDTLGTARTITNSGATMTWSNVDFRDITLGTAYDASAITGNSGDAGGNTNITFTPAATQYWYRNTGSWSDSTKWFLATNGVGAGRVPLPQDDVVFDANSFSTGSQTVTLDMPRAGKSINWTGATNTPAWAKTVSPTIYGSVTMIAGMTNSTANPITMEGRGSFTWTSAGLTFNCDVTVQMIGGTLTMQDAFISSGTLTIANGTLNANNFNITMSDLSSNSSNVRTITMGSGTWTITSGVWNITTATNLTLNANTSTIKLTNTGSGDVFFRGGGKTYNNLWWARGAGTGSNTITGSNTFADFKDDGSAAHSILFTAGTTQTVSTFTVSGSSGNVITLDSTTTGTYTLSKSSGKVSSDYLNIQHAIATGGAVWFAGANSTNNQATATSGSGWIFRAAPDRVIASGGGNWSSAGTWVEGIVPTASENVGAYSGSGNLTIDVAAAARSVDLTDYVGTLTHNSAITLSIGDATAGTGNVALKFVAGMTYTKGNVATSAISFISTSATQQTITTGGKTLGNITFNAASGGSWILSDAFSISIGTIILTKGSLDTNGQTVSFGNFSGSNSNVRSLTLGASALNQSVSAGGTVWSLTTTTNLTFNAGTSTMTFAGSDVNFNGGDLTYNNVVLSGSGTATINGVNTFANLTRTGTAVKTDGLSLSANQTVTGVLTLTGNSAINRVLVRSDTLGTARTITNSGATMTWSNVDFRDITLGTAYNASAITGNSGDAGGNSGITFTTAATQYWYRNTGSWSDSTKWFLATNGVGAGRVPLPQDDVVFDANSFSTGSQTVTLDMPRAGKSINWTGATNTPAWAKTTATTVYGSVTMVSGMTNSGVSSVTMEGRSSYTWTSAGQTFSSLLTVAMVGGTLTLQDAFLSTIVSGSAFLHTAGTFDANNFNVTAHSINTNGSIVRALTLGSGTWTLSATGTPWAVSGSNLTLTANTSTVKFTDSSSTGKTFSGGGKTYNNFWFATGAGTGTLTVSGSNTFADFKDDGSAAHSILFTAGTTQTVTTFTVSGISGNVITLNSTTTGTYTLSKSSGKVSSDYLNIQHAIATGGAVWFAGANSTNNQATATSGSGWIFRAAPDRVIASGGGNWSSAGTWVEGIVPTASENVGAYSGSGNLTIDAAASARSVDLTDYVGTLTHNSAITLSIGDATAGTGNVALKLVAGMTYTLGSSSTSAISFISTSATVQTVATGGKTLGNVTFNASSNGSWQLADSFTAGSAAKLTLTQGTLDTNGQAVNVGEFSSSNGNTRVLTLGASAITITAGGNAWNTSTSLNLTLNAGTSVITMTSTSNTFDGGGKTFYGLVQSAAASTINGANTFTNLTKTGAASKTDSLSLSANQTVTGTLTLAGNSVTNRLLVQSNTLGTARTITNTGATMTWSNVDLRDITLGTSYDASAITGNSGDAGGNTNITFTTAATQYWYRNTGSWSDSTKWFLATNGVSAGRVPLPQDDVVFDANSFSTGSQTVTMDMPRAGKSINWTGATNTPAWAKSTATTIYGSVTMIAAMSNTQTSTVTLEGRGAFTFTSVGQTFSNDLTMQMVGGTLTFQDDFLSTIGSTNAFVVRNGTLNLNDHNFTAATLLTTGSDANTLTLGSGIVTITGTSSTFFINNSSTVITSTTGTIIISNITAAQKIFRGIGKTYGTLTITGDNVVISDSNTFTTLNVNTAGLTTGLLLTSGTTQTVTNFATNGSSGNLAKLISTSAGSAATISKSSGKISVDYMSIKDSTVTGGAVWFAGANSTSVSGNTGWIFRAAPDRVIASGGGNWSSAGTWVEGIVPTASDNVGAYSGSGNLTIDVAASARSLDLTDYVGTLTHNSAITLSIGDATAGTGNVALKLVAGMTYTKGSVTSSAISFISTSTTVQTVATGGQVLGNTTFNGVAGSWQLSDTFSSNGSVNTSLGLTNGTLNTNGQTVNIGFFASNGATTRVLTLGASAINISGDLWNVASTNLTFNANTSVITASGDNHNFYGASLTYNSVIFTGGGTTVMRGVNTFATLTKTGTASKTGILSLEANQTVTGTLTLAGNSATNRFLVQSNTLGTARTITNTGATMTWSNVDFRDITLGTSYDASAITGNSGDAGGNSGITFTPAATQYWFKDTGNWSDSTKWFLATNGGGGAGRVPLPQDDAVFDANSFSAGSKTVTADMPRLGKNINWTGVTNTPTLSINSASNTIYGSLTLVSGMNLTTGQTPIFEGRSSYTLTSGGKSFGSVTMQMFGGTLTLQDDLAMSLNTTFTLNNGVFDANNHNFTAGIFSSSNSNLRTITMGSGIWTMTYGGGAAIWDTTTSTNLTLNRGSNVILTGVGNGGGYYGSSLVESKSVGFTFTATAGNFYALSSAAAYNVDFSGSTATFNLGNDLTIYGDLTIGSGTTMAGSSTVTFAATSGTKTITTNGKTIDAPVIFNGVGGTWQLGDDLTVGSTRTVTLTNGTLDANNHNISMGLFSSSNSNTRVITMGSGTWTLSGTGTVWDIATNTNLTLTPNASTIAISNTSATAKTFAGAGKTYNNITFSGDNITMSGSNTFATMAVNNAGLSNGLKLTSGTTQTVTGFTTNASVGSIAKLVSTSGGSAATISKSTGKVSVDYMSIQDSTATGGAVWFAGGNSTSVSGNTGWIFRAAPDRVIASGGGNWSSAATWVEGIVPTASENVGAYSGSGNLTIDVAASARSLDLTDYVGTLTHNSAITLSIGDATAGTGNVALKLVAGMTYTLGSTTTSAISFVSTSATQQTITTGGKTLGNVTFNASSNGSWQLADNIGTNTSANWTLTKGTLDTNSKTLSISTFSSNNSNVRSLTLGTSSITCNGDWDFDTVTNLTVSAGSSTVTLNGVFSTFYGDGKTWGNVVITSGTGSQGSNKFGTVLNLTKTGGVSKGDSLIIAANFTVTGTLTLTGNSTTNRLLVKSITLGTAITITNSGATMTWSNVDFRDITLGTAYDASAITGLSGDAGGNSGITFTTAATQYWYRNTGSWSDSTKWFLATNGVSAGRVPLPQDDVVFDANSFSTGSQTITLDMPRAGKSINWTGATNTPAFTISSISHTVYGSLTLISGMTLNTSTSVTTTFEDRGSFTLTSAGKSFGGVALSMIGGTLTLQDDMAVGVNNGFTLNNGTFNANSYNVTTGGFSSSNSNTRTLTLGSGTWTVNGAITAWNISTTSGLTFNANTSTIVVSNASATAKTFDGGGLTYSTLTVSGDNVTVAGSNTFTTLNVNTAGLTNGLKLTSGTTQTITNFSTNGSAGNLAKLVSTSSGSAATISKASGFVSVDYMSIKDSTATGGASFYAGANSTSVSGNTGWRFIAPNVDHFTWATITSKTAGSLFTVVITAKDSLDNLTIYDTDGTVFGGTESVVFTTTATASADGNTPTYNGSDLTGAGVTISVDLSSGSFTTSNIILYDSGETPTLTITHNTKTGASNSITVNPASAASLRITGTASMTAGATNELTVTAKDSYGNTDTGYTGSKTLTFSGLATGLDGSVPSIEGTNVGTSQSVTFTSGATSGTSTTLTAYKAETASLDVSDGTLNSTGSTSFDLDLVVSPAALASLTVSGISSPVDSGLASSATITAKDTYQNIKTNYTGTLAFSSTDSSATLPSDYTFTGGDAGVHSFSDGITLRTSGTQSVTATSGAISGSQSGITVNALASAASSSSGVPPGALLAVQNSLYIPVPVLISAGPEFPPMVMSLPVAISAPSLGSATAAPIMPPPVSFQNAGAAVVMPAPFDRQIFNGISTQPFFPQPVSFESATGSLFMPERLDTGGANGTLVMPQPISFDTATGNLFMPARLDMDGANAVPVMPRPISFDRTTGNLLMPAPLEISGAKGTAVMPESRNRVSFENVQTYSRLPKKIEINFERASGQAFLPSPIQRVENFFADVRLTTRFTLKGGAPPFEEVNVETRMPIATLESTGEMNGAENNSNAHGITNPPVTEVPAKASN